MDAFSVHKFIALNQTRLPTSEEQGISRRGWQKGDGGRGWGGWFRNTVVLSLKADSMYLARLKTERSKPSFVASPRRPKH